MLTISADDVDRALTFPGLVETLRDGVPGRRGAAGAPPPHGRAAGRRGLDAAADAGLDRLSTPPALPTAAIIGVKIVTVSPDNNAIGKPAVMGLYLLLDGSTGEPQALIDGQRLTQWRTACASALAASYLAREDASKLLVIGAGALAPFLARAHAAVRPIREIRIWNRTPANAEKAAAALRRRGLNAMADDRSRRGARLGRHRLVARRSRPRRWSRARC